LNTGHIRAEKQFSGYISRVSLWATAAAFFFCYYGSLESLFHIWNTDDDYSYAYLIPAVTGYILWERRKKILSARLRPNWWGAIPFLMFLLLSIYGILGSSPSAVRPAIPLMILSIVLFCFGGEMMRLVAFPVCFLFFMIPLPTILQSKITVPLKSISTKIGVAVLRMMNITVFAEGNVIDLGITQLQVVDACSGLRYVLPLLALGIVFAYFFEKTRWKQILLALSTIPISILTNGFRIGTTGLLTKLYGVKVAEGFFHGFSGWIVFMFAFGLLFILHFFLKKSGKTASTGNPPISPPEKSAKSSRPFSPLPAFIVVLSLLFAGLAGYSTATIPPLFLRNGMSNFPLTFGDWNGMVQRMDESMILASGAEEAFSGDYRNSKGKTIDLYIGYRGSPFLENENFFHSPNICLPSTGWKILAAGTHEIRDIPFFNTAKVHTLLVEKTGVKQLVYYWFQTKNRVSHDININRFHLTLHALERDATHDLFIRPTTVIHGNETVEDAQTRMDQFVRELTSALLTFLSEQEKRKES